MYRLKKISSRAATAENPNAEPGAGGVANGGRKGAPCLDPFRSGTTHVLLDARGPGIVRHIWCTVPPGQLEFMRGVILRMYWDGQEQPSVEVPLGDFFGVSHGRQCEMISDYVSMQAGKGFNCWIPMPFRKSARITVENDVGRDISMLFYQVDFTLGDEIDETCGYFHAQFRRSNPCPIHEDYVILDGVEGQGIYLGTVLGVRSLYKDAWWGEGEIKFFLDGDEAYPTICGTGTEDYMGSAWGLDVVVTPQQGAPLVEHQQGLYSLYRFHGKDPIYFQNQLRVTVQQIGCGSGARAGEFFGGEFVRYPAAGVPADSDTCYFDRSDDYSSVAYWYQALPTAPFPKLPNRRERLADIPLPAENTVKRND